MRLLITGIDGFTGRHLKNYLEKNSKTEIFGTSRKFENNKVFKCDINDRNNVRYVLNEVKPDIIIHLAAVSFVASENTQNFYNVNTLGTQNIFEENRWAEKVIVASSAVVYGRQGKEVLDEGMCVNPNNHYGLSKYGAEQIAKNYIDKSGVIITRPFNYTGPGQDDKFLVPKIVKHFKEGKKEIELGNLDVVREFNDIDFVCEVYKRLIFSDIKNEIVNIASSRGIRLLDVIRYMEDIAGYKIKIKINPKYVRKNDIPKLLGSNKKLFSLIGEVKQKPFYETLRDMYEYSD